MSGLRLPSTLVDLVFSRAYPPVICTNRRLALLPVPGKLVKRFAQSVAVLRPRLDVPILEPEQGVNRNTYLIKTQGQQTSLFNSPASRTTTQLEEHVLKLKQLAGTGTDALVYTEDELLAVYEDLLAVHPDQKLDKKARHRDRDKHEAALQIVRVAIGRLCEDGINGHERSHRALISRLEAMATTLQQASASVGLQDGTADISASIVTGKEWEALIECAVQEQDSVSAEHTLVLMKCFGIDPSERCLNIVLGFYASIGDVARAEQLMKKYLSDMPSESQRDMHVKAHVRSVSHTAFPSEALRVLHDYELRGLPAPQRTYTQLITHLFCAESSVCYAHAWDLFSHMRYVAHPKPDVVTYTVMLRACASSALSPSGEPERALDLFTEMTVDNRIQPTAGAYTAAILACARSGQQTYVHEAFRLAKEMLDSYRDARGMSAFTLDQRFFCALLEGAKRIGDLGRVRWILAEMVKAAMGAKQQGVTISEDTIVQENVMLHVFHAYTAYRPPFRPSMTVVVDQQKGTDRYATSTESSASQEELDVVTRQHMSFGQLPPQTHGEIVQEVETLFARILEDRNTVQSANGGEGSPPPVFQHVQLTPKLLNAYLSVHYAHSSFDTWCQLFKTLHAQHAIPRNVWSYADVLERCARCKKGPERRAALQFAEEVWREWSPLERAWRSGFGDVVNETMTPRLIERIHSAMIRILALNGRLDLAVAHVKAFARSYPPSAIRQPREKLPFRSTRTRLVGARPLIRLFTDVDIPDDTVPPSLTFAEVEVLHQKLVAANRVADVSYLKWVCKSYEGALRARRDATMHAKPAYGDADVPELSHEQSLQEDM